MSLQTVRNILVQPWDSNTKKYEMTRDMAILGLKFSEHVYDYAWGSSEMDDFIRYGILGGMTTMRDLRTTSSLLQFSTVLGQNLEDSIAWRIYDDDNPWYSSGLGYTIYPEYNLDGVISGGTTWTPGASFDPEGSDLTKFPPYWMKNGIINGATGSWYDLQRISIIDMLVDRAFSVAGSSPNLGPWPYEFSTMGFPGGVVDAHPELVMYGCILDNITDVSQRIYNSGVDYYQATESYGRQPYGQGNWSPDPPYTSYEKVNCVRDHGVCPYYIDGTCKEDQQLYLPISGRWKKFAWQTNQCKSRIWQQDDPNGSWTGCYDGTGVTPVASGYSDLGTGHSFMRFEVALRVLYHMINLGCNEKNMTAGFGGSFDTRTG